MDNGKFIISLDFELHWGGVEVWDINQMKDYFSNTIKIIPEILALFRENEIRCTWATVGFLFAKNKRQLKVFLPEKIPTYNRKYLSTYNQFNEIGNDERDDPFHFAPSLIRDILDTPGQELASHTFSHYYCNEDGQTVEQFDLDMKAAQDIASENFNIKLFSLVFPRNQFNSSYLEAVKKNGIEVIRTNPNVWFWNNDYGKFTPIFRALDTIFPISKSLSFKNVIYSEGLVFIPASRFFRPFKKREKLIQNFKLRRIKNEMTYAAKNKLNYHLWWHPHNFGSEPIKNLEQLNEIIKHYNYLKRKYQFSSKSMADFNDNKKNNIS